MPEAYPPQSDVRRRNSVPVVPPSVRIFGLRYEYTWTSAIFMDDVGVLEFAAVCQLDVGDPATCNSIISWYGSEAMVTPLDASTCHTCWPLKYAVMDWPGMN